MKTRMSGDYIKVQQLLMGCPFAEELSDCPFQLSRKLAVAIRVEALEGDSEQHFFKLIQHHKRCLYNRERRSRKLPKDLKHPAVL